MVIKISQTASNIMQKFDIYYDYNYMYEGELGSYNRYQKILLKKNEEAILEGRFYVSSAKNFIPFRHLFGLEDLSQNVKIFDKENEIASFVYSKHGFLKSCYKITYKDKAINCYKYSKGRFDYVSFYLNEKQIAELQIYTTIVDQKYNYKIYLLDEYKELTEILSMFVLYYANYNYTERFHMSKGTEVSYTLYQLTRYKKKYNPSWVSTHFSQSNFFVDRTWIEPTIT